MNLRTKNKTQQKITSNVVLSKTAISKTKLVHSSDTDDSKTCPINPTNFMEFIPWACGTFGIGEDIEMTRIAQAEYTSIAGEKKKGKPKPPATATAAVLNSSQNQQVSGSTVSTEQEENLNVIRVVATFAGDDLVYIKINHSRHIPREFLCIIKLVIGFYPHLYGFAINRGAHGHSICELRHLIALSNITEICLDDTFIKEANFDILLDDPHNLKILSLSRCKLNDLIIEKIAGKLCYPASASKRLCALNLSSNSLTDKAAVHIAEALRTNRKLAFLNIAGNMITDEGARAILDVLKIFPLTLNEVTSLKRRYMKYLKKKERLIDDYVTDLRLTGDYDKRGLKKRRHTLLKDFNKKGKDRNVVLAADPQELLLDGILYEKANDMAMKQMGEFEDPLNDSYSENSLLYCNGNNTLAYINIAYNNISFLTLQVLLTVLRYQSQSKRNPVGLNNVCVEGNQIPDCKELIDIENYIEYALFQVDPNKSKRKPKPNK